VDAIGRLACDGIAVGTAFVVSADGVAATAEHVIGSQRDARWSFEPLAAPGLLLPVDVALPADPTADVALVRIAEAGDWQPMTLASHTNISPGYPVHLRGFAKSLDYDSGIGRYVGETGEHGRVWVKVSCQHAQPGMSGAPVLLTGTGCVIGLISARLNTDRWNRDTVLVSRSEDIVALAPERLRLTEPVQRHLGGTLRLSWDRGNTTDHILETDDFNVTLGRSSANMIFLKDSRDSRFHGKLGLVGSSLVYQHLGSHPAFLISATRQVKISTGVSCQIGDKDRLRFASGVILIEFSAPDLYDPNAGPTASADGEGVESGN
jgi:hypothetical protein